jgi:acetyl esterase/lipase
VRLLHLACAGLCVAALAAAGGHDRPAAGAATLPSSAPSPGRSVTVTFTYCNHEQARLTEPARTKEPAPAVVYVHGGSWVSGNDETGGFIITKIGPALASRGFVVMSLDYRLGPASPWPDQIEDVTCAVRYLRAHAGSLHVDSSHIGAWGQSAGGHLVGLLGTAGAATGWDAGAYANESSRVEAVVDMAGPSDLLTMTNQGDSGNVRAAFVSLLGPRSPRELTAALRAASPVTYVRPGDPPFLIFHSTNDEIVYPQQSQELAWDLAANGDPVRLVMVTGGGHDFDQVGQSPGVDAITRMIVAFFVTHLHPQERT